MLHFAHRTAPDQKYTDLNPDLVSWPARVRLAAENGYFEFRGSQIELELSELRQTYTIEGGDEIAIFNGAPVSNPSIQTPLWSGTVDPAKITRDEITHRLSFRVLQHGSLLNTIFAGLDDWTLDSGSQLETIPGRPYRYKGTADQWLRQITESGAGNNVIESENETVYYTPTAKDALTDPLYKSKFAEKVHHFHTGNKILGGVEWPFPNSTGDDGSTIWTGPFKQHYRPNFDVEPENWDNYVNGVSFDAGSYVRNKDMRFGFRRQDIAEILSDLINQFNRTARFPLAFDPDTDCSILSPRIEQVIEIIQRNPRAGYIDLYFAGWQGNPLYHRVFVLVNYLEDSATVRAALYVIENETELTPIMEDIAAYPDYRWPGDQEPYNRGFRFAHESLSRSQANSVIFYTYSVGGRPIEGESGSALRFTIAHADVNIINLSTSQLTHSTWDERLGDYELHGANDPILRRSAIFNGTDFSHMREPVGPGVWGDPTPPERLPLQAAEDDNRRLYRVNQRTGLTVSGALFDRVAIDAEDARLSTLITDLAKLTNSRWWITPDRRLKFMSRQLTGPQRAVPSASLRRPARTFTRSFEQESPPAISQNLVVPQNYQQALDQWYRDEILPNSATGRDLAVTLSDLSDVALHDHLLVEGDATPSAVTSIDIVGDNTLEITTETPIVPAP